MTDFVSFLKRETLFSGKVVPWSDENIKKRFEKPLEGRFEKQSSSGVVERSSADPMEKEFRRLVEDLYTPVVNFFARKGVPLEERDDLAQETFLRAYRGFARFRGDAKVNTWLFRIANNVWKNALRDLHAAKRDAQEVSLNTMVEEGQPISRDRVFTNAGGEEGPLRGLLDQERKRLLRTALDSLPPQMKYCVQLRLQDLKYREIAAIQKISVETVKAHLFQARKRLKESLGEYFEQIDFGGDREREED